ncbi:MAG: class I SAM-dependent methyltransferase [Microscillaceae bacterium]|nr:class I SAM-dependent methyltransferase [Microscillaceae bacterium]
MFSTTEITSGEKISDNPVHQRLVCAYVEASKIISGNLLEVGCGFGRGLDLLVANSSTYTAIDKNKKLIDQLSQQYPSLTFIEQHIPPFKGIADNNFDFVVSFQVIEHIVDDQSFVKEIHRVLKPGGSAIITTPNIKLSLTRNPWHVREYTAEDLKKLLGKYFPEVQTQGIHGNEKVMQYYAENKAAVQKITRFDIFNLQYRLPRQLLQVPYDLLNRLNRKNLHKQNTGLVAEIDYTDYFLSEKPEESLDLFYRVRK